MEQQVSRSRDCLARPGPELSEGMKFSRARIAEQPIPGVRPDPHHAGEAGLEIAKLNRANQARKVRAERPRGGDILLALVDGHDQENRGARERRRYRLCNDTRLSLKSCPPLISPPRFLVRTAAADQGLSFDLIVAGPPLSIRIFGPANPTQKMSPLPALGHNLLARLFAATLSLNVEFGPTNGQRAVGEKCVLASGLPPRRRYSRPQALRPTPGWSATEPTQLPRSSTSMPQRRLRAVAATNPPRVFANSNTTSTLMGMAAVCSDRSCAFRPSSDRRRDGRRSRTRRSSSQTNCPPRSAATARALDRPALTPLRVSSSYSPPAWTSPGLASIPVAIFLANSTPPHFGLQLLSPTEHSNRRNRGCSRNRRKTHPRCHDQRRRDSSPRAFDLGADVAGLRGPRVCGMAADGASDITLAHRSRSLASSARDRPVSRPAANRIGLPASNVSR